MNKINYNGEYIIGKGEEYIKNLLKEKDSCCLYDINFLANKNVDDPLIKEIYKYAKVFLSRVVFLSFKPDENFNEIEFIKYLYVSIYGIYIKIFSNVEDTNSWGSIYLDNTPASTYFGVLDENKIEHLMIIFPIQFSNDLISNRLEMLTDELFIARLKGGLRDAKVYE